MSQYFKSIIVNNENDTIDIDIKKRSINDLPQGNLLIKVEYSSLNYKDALSASGITGVTKHYPHTPGIDAAGVVMKSNDNDFPLGTCVIVTGFDMGMNTSGGFSEYIRVPSKWAIKCPSNLTTKEAMLIGTAGLTAGLSITSICDTIILKNSEVIVSGATGGVGSIGVNLLSNLGAKVTAITGKINKKKNLMDLGASCVVERNDFIKSTKLPLSKGIYNAALDVVGGEILSSIIASMKYNGIITATGNVSSPKFETTVFPFILRANSLIGIDSANCPIEKRKKVWEHFASDWKLNFPNEMQKTVNLENMIPEIQKILNGEQVGRVLLKL
ncbi:MAG: YhdH/YhfP family quinone oxidoreductase [Candidatus Neomarinimicrobiota bacterium]